MVQPNQPSEYTFTYNGQGSFAYPAIGIHPLRNGESITLPREAVHAAHGSVVASGLLSVSPQLPADIVSRGSQASWRDVEFIQSRDRVCSSNTKIVFASDAPTTGSVSGTGVDIVVEVQDADNVVNLLDSFESVKITADAGSILSCTGDTGDFTLPGLNARGQFTAGRLTIKVLRTTSGSVGLTLSLPGTTGLTVTDTHSISFS